MKLAVDNWKQHYTSWVMIWSCGVRPGSFTVAPGYGKGDSLGKYIKAVRKEDETLRWSDIKIFYFPGGLGVRIT